MSYISCNIKHLVEGSLSTKDTGLGNTLFQIATQYAFSRKYGFTMDLRELRVYTDKLRELGFDHDNTIFRETFRCFELQPYPQLEYTLISEEHDKGEIYDADFHNQVMTCQDKHIKINGYLQSFMYFNDYRLELYSLFKPPREFEEYVQVQYPEIFNDEIVSVSIHVRMNYANNVNYTRSFFVESVQHFKEKYGPEKVHFFVFSNNHDEIRGWFDDQHASFTIVNENNDYMDLWTMMLCNHNIISHSTFAWWGAYLNRYPKKEVHYPRDSLRVWWGQLLDHEQLAEREFEHYLPEWKCVRSNTMYTY